MGFARKRKMNKEKNDFDKMEFKENLPGQKASDKVWDNLFFITQILIKQFV